MYTKIKVLLLLLLTTPAWGQQKASVANLRGIVEVLASDSLRGRAYRSEEIKVARQFIIDQYEKIGLKPFDDGYIHNVKWHDQLLGEQQVSNIVGYIEGSDPKLKDEFIIVGAHYDHVGYTTFKDTVIFNGADDNASGVSGIIELSRIILSGNSRPVRSILIIAFDAEEVGLYGSKRFVQNSPVPLDKIKAMISVDMIGHADLIKGVEFSGVGSLLGVTIPQSIFNSDTLKVKLKSNPSYMIGHTDTEPFFKKKIPSLYVNTGLKANYHKPSDDANTLNYEGMAFVVDNLKPLVLYLAAQPNLHFTNPIPSLAYGLTFTGGLNRFKITNGGVDNKSSLTYSVGLTSLLKLTKKSAIQADLLFKGKSSQSATGKIFMPGIHIPLHFMLISPYSTFRSFIGFGPYYSFSFYRYIDGNKQPISNSERNDYGLNFVVGGIIMKYQVALRSSYGLKRLIEYQPDMHYRSVEISVTRFLRY